jgi:hypothetical protein
MPEKVTFIGGPWDQRGEWIDCDNTFGPGPPDMYFVLERPQIESLAYDPSAPDVANEVTQKKHAYKRARDKFWWVYIHESLWHIYFPPSPPHEGG